VTLDARGVDFPSPAEPTEAVDPLSDITMVMTEQPPRGTVAPRGHPKNGERGHLPSAPEAPDITAPDIRQLESLAGGSTRGVHTYSRFSYPRLTLPLSGRVILDLGHWFKAT
jgi:hypothetical protein